MNRSSSRLSTSVGRFAGSPEEDHAVADAAGEPAVLADAERPEDADRSSRASSSAASCERRERVQVDVLVDEGDVVVARPGRTVIERRSRGRERAVDVVDRQVLDLRLVAMGLERAVQAGPSHLRVVEDADDRHRSAAGTRAGHGALSTRLRGAGQLCGDRHSPAEIVVQRSRLLQLADPVDPQVPRAEELVGREPVADVGVVKLLDPAAHGPTRLEVRQDPRDLRAVDLIGALVGPTAGGERRPRSGDDLLDDLGHVPNPVVLGARADVEGLVVDELARGLEHGEERSRDVLDVHERAPGRPVALDQDLARGHRVSDQVVDHDVDAKSRRDTVGGRVAQVGRAEGIVGELGDARSASTFDCPYGVTGANPAPSSSISSPALP